MISLTHKGHNGELNPMDRSLRIEKKIINYTHKIEKNEISDLNFRFNIIFLHVLML